ncbi:MAG: M48 family metalloprotease [Candidatus Aenigmarchaeota archaeon]|nr:M48 family metalloprotease [Candidatus Aenigmarchaeota archaeon]
MRLFIASLFTLILLSGFLIAILLSLLYFTGLIDIYLLFGLTILINFVLWLVCPTISDWIYRFFYKLRWVTIDELRKTSPASADFLVKTCRKYNFNVPKLGIIPDKNPNAFTYGSGRWNGRTVVTEGIFKYLDENERVSVYAHELGHIKNRDFMIMTIASTLLQLLYEVYVVSRRVAVSSKGGGKKKGGGLPFLVIMVAAYIFDWIGQYVVLYLSRVREYYADEFSAKETNPNYLSSALIKISYGILVNPDDVRLVKSTKYIGLTDFKLSENIGLVYYNCQKLKNFEPLNRVLLYDIKNPWAFVTELKSTHPLTGKRLRRLSQFSTKPLFNFDTIEQRNPIDKGRMYSIFFKDVGILILPTLLAIGFPVLYLLSVYLGYLALSFQFFIGVWFAIIGIGVILATLYRYPEKTPENSTVIDLMSDLYASPVRGRAVKLNGKLIGRGVPGLIFSEDMVIQDRTGLMFLNYESWLPLIGNLIFGLRKVPKLVNKDAKISGWFLRGVSPLVGLKMLETTEEKIRGFVKLGGLIGGLLLIIIGSIFFFVIGFASI